MYREGKKRAGLICLLLGVMSILLLVCSEPRKIVYTVGCLMLISTILTIILLLLGRANTICTKIYMIAYIVSVVVLWESKYISRWYVITLSVIIISIFGRRLLRLVRYCYIAEEEQNKLKKKVDECMPLCLEVRAGEIRWNLAHPEVKYQIPVTSIDNVENCRMKEGIDDIFSISCARWGIYRYEKKWDRQESEIDTLYKRLSERKDMLDWDEAMMTEKEQLEEISILDNEIRSDNAEFSRLQNKHDKKYRRGLRKIGKFLRK